MTSLPLTIWAPYNGNGELSAPGVNNIVDTLGNNLVDTSSNQVVDTGIELTLLAGTVWTSSDGS